MRVDKAEGEYNSAINSLNLVIDQFHTNYKSILNRIQGSDESCINQLKFTLEKFAGVLDQMGKGIRDRSDEVGECVQMISHKTDIQIFIEHHRCNNPIYQKEQSQPYTEESDMPGKS